MIWIGSKGSSVSCFWYFNGKLKYLIIIFRLLRFFFGRTLFLWRLFGRLFYWFCWLRLLRWLLFFLLFDNLLINSLLHGDNCLLLLFERIIFIEVHDGTNA